MSSPAEGLKRNNRRTKSTILRLSYWPALGYLAWDNADHRSLHLTPACRAVLKGEQIIHLRLSSKRKPSTSACRMPDSILQTPKICEKIVTSNLKSKVDEIMKKQIIERNGHWRRSQQQSAKIFEHQNCCCPDFDGLIFIGNKSFLNIFSKTILQKNFHVAQKQHNVA